MAESAVDTNIFLRTANREDPLHSLAQKAIDMLDRRGDRVMLLPQNLYEFYTVATRPKISRGGLGLNTRSALYQVDRLLELFELLPDSPQILPEWRQLIQAHSVSGVAAHDARIVAAMNVHRISNLLTLNTADFKRYSHITVLHPNDIV